jgi:hypothetical protein
MTWNNGIFMQRLKKFDTSAIRYEMRASLAITEDIILAELAKTAFFSYAALHGETALRLFEGINRYYGQLNFSLIKSAKEFLWESYLHAITETMAEYGCALKTAERHKQGNIITKDSVPDGSRSCLLNFNWAQRYSGRQQGMIRLRINANPLHSEGVISQKQHFRGIGDIRIFDLPTIRAQKYRSLLCRGHEKGRDWYDLLRFDAKKIEPNYRYLEAALNQSGPWKGQALAINKEWLAATITNRMDNLNFDAIKRDMCRFVDNDEYDRVAGWDKKTFSDLVYSQLSNNDS